MTVERVTVRDLCLDGRLGGAPVFVSRYGAVLSFTAVDTMSCTGDAWVLTQAWDCRYWDCRWTDCADTTGQAACIRFRNSSAVSGFGASTDTTNEQRFFGCVWETFRGHAVWVEAGPGNNAPPNGFTFTGCKWETGIGRRPFLFMDPAANVQCVNMIDGYLALVNSDAGAAPFHLVECAVNDSYRDVRVTVGRSGTVTSVFRVGVGGTHCFDNVAQVGQPVTTAFINVAGGDGAVTTRALRFPGSVDAVALNGGVTSPAGMEVVRVMGAGRRSMSDAEFTAYGGLRPVKNASGALVKDTTDGSYRFFVRTESSVWRGVVLDAS